MCSMIRPRRDLQGRMVGGRGVLRGTRLPSRHLAHTTVLFTLQPGNQRSEVRPFAPGHTANKWPNQNSHAALPGASNLDTVSRRVLSPRLH